MTELKSRGGERVTRAAVQEQSAAAHRGEEFVGRGIKDRRDDRYASFDQCGRNAKLRHPIHQGLCPVDGVHNPDARVGKSSRIVGRFFREPSILWKLPALHLMQDSVDLVVHGGDRRTVRLCLHLESNPDQFTHLRAGVPDRFDQRCQFSFHVACLAEWNRKSSRSRWIGKAERRQPATRADPSREHAYKQGVLRGFCR